MRAEPPAAMDDARVGEWGQTESRALGAPAWALVGLVVVVGAAVIGAAGWALISPFAGTAAAVVWLAVCAGWVWLQPRRALRALGRPRRDTPLDARLENLARGLARDLALPEPLVLVARDGHANAVASHVRRPALAISERFLERLTRTELEAVVAHCLLRARPEVVRGYAAWSALGRLAMPAGREAIDDDLRTVGRTRYPPALASALGKAEPASGSLRPFFFAAGDVDARRRALADL